MTRDHFPAANADVDDRRLWPAERGEFNHASDRVWKDCWSKDGKHFRVEDDTAQQNCWGLPDVRNRSVTATKIDAKLTGKRQK